MLVYSTYTDEELLRLLPTNDHNAFAELYERYWDKLLYLAGKKLGDLHEAEHIVQDVFLDLWHRRATLNIQQSVGGYLVVAIKYRIINAQAKRHRQLLRMQEKPYDQFDNSTEEYLHWRELQHRYHHQLARLPEKCALAFSLRNEGLSYKEIAAEMKVSEKTVEMHINRAFKALRTALGILGFILIIVCTIYYRFFF
jgi:RNA polymerase sigma-70 factor, Bacteroides expansion family 1